RERTVGNDLELAIGTASRRRSHGGQAMRRFALVLVLFSLLAPARSDAVTRRMFVTSVTGTGKLSKWDDAGGNSGLAAGDAICQKRAELAGLPNFSGYRAWLSDASDDAYCRVHGLTGKKVGEKCHQDPLPASAGPWEIADIAIPFSGPITQLL